MVQMSQALDQQWQAHRNMDQIYVDRSREKQIIKIVGRDITWTDSSFF